MHPNGKRLSTYCPLREKCSSADCELNHPICRLDKSCPNSKCGFSHTDGKRFTREQKNPQVVGDLLNGPNTTSDQSQKLDFVQHSYSITDLKRIQRENNQPVQFSSNCVDAGIKAAGRTIHAMGHVTFVDSTRRKCISVRIFAPSVASCTQRFHFLVKAMRCSSLESRVVFISAGSIIAQRRQSIVFVNSVRQQRIFIPRIRSSADKVRQA